MTTWHMTATQQGNSLVVAVFVVAVIFYGLAAIWRDWRKSWDADDFADAYYNDRDQHVDAREAMQGRWVAE